jgi:hypothetical protein
VTILSSQMRRLILICLLAAGIVPASALATQFAPGDGTLAVRNAGNDAGQLVVALSVAGATLGQVDRGRITILPAPGPEPEVTGAERQIDRADGSTVYIGMGIRFRAITGTFRARIYGTGIDINAVGQGTVRLFGTPFSTGKFALNGGAWTPLPDIGTTFAIGS